MGNRTYQQRSNQDTKVPVSQRRIEGGKVLEDNRAAFNGAAPLSALKNNPLTGQLAAMTQTSPTMAAQRNAVENVSNSPYLTAQRQRLDTLTGDSTRQLKKPEALSEKTEPAQRLEAPTRPNNTGLPDNLKNGIESLSGLSMDNVKVHYNSAKPAQLNALAYAQGTDIHVGPGQEQHLPHEAWHVVQQAQGRVQPTMQMKNGVPINDDIGLEREADVMGVRALSQSNLWSGHSAQLSMPTRAETQTPLQRTIDVTHVDYDPIAQEFRNGIIEQQMFTALRTLIYNDGALALYRNQLNNVIQHVGGQDFAAPDVDQLAAAIRNAIVQRYAHYGIVIGGGAQDLILSHAVTAITQNIRADHAVAMDHAESTGFDQLMNIVGAVGMSRAKGNASDIGYDQLPGALPGRIDNVLAQIRAENLLWTAAGSLAPQAFLQTFQNMPDIANRLDSYQGNHSNMAEWLPIVPAPARTLRTLKDHVQPRIWRIVNDDTASDRLGYTGPNVGRPNELRGEYENGVLAAYGAMNDATARLMAWAELAAGVSGYIEFNMPGGISRLCYDVVNGHIYISAHYKWRAGYNPWFRVTGFPAV